MVRLIHKLLNPYWRKCYLSQKRIYCDREIMLGAWKAYVQKLERENKELKQENEELKKAQS